MLRGTAEAGTQRRRETIWLRQEWTAAETATRNRPQPTQILMPTIIEKAAAYLRKTRHAYLRDVAKAIYYAVFRKLRISRHRRRLVKQYGINSLPLVRSDTLLGPGPHELSHYTFTPWSPTPLEYALVQALARRLRPCHFLEIGSLRGELLANLNGIVESSTAITLSKEDLDRMGFDKALVDTNMMFADDVQNLRLVYADSKVYDFSTLPRKFNLAFVDGNHLHEFVKSDTEKVLSVCTPESAMIWHDYVLADHTTVHWEVFAGILDGLPRELWKRLYHVNNTTCAVLLPASWTVSPHDHVFYPEKVYSIQMTVSESIKR